jgi:hypothetical protein
MSTFGDAPASFAGTVEPLAFLMVLGVLEPPQAAASGTNSAQANNTSEIRRIMESPGKRIVLPQCRLRPWLAEGKKVRESGTRGRLIP